MRLSRLEDPQKKQEARPEPPKPSPSFSWDEISAIRPAKVEGFTRGDYAREFNISLYIAAKEIALLLKEGKLRVVGERSAPNGGGRAPVYAKA